jgi:signal transduction histidine kinase
MMSKFSTIACLLVGVLAAGSCLALEAPPDSRSISQLEERRAAITAELQQLAIYSLRTGATGTSGYRSLQQDEPFIEGEWVEIDLGKVVPIDEIVLVPTLWRYDAEGYRSDGFPEAFRIVAGTGEDRSGSVIAQFDSTDKQLPRIAPVVFPLKGVQASWIRIEPTRLSLRERDHKYIFQLAEVFVFSGEENVALQKPVETASPAPMNSGIWRPAFMVDGFVPYLMASAGGPKSSDYVQLLAENPTLTLDLEKEHPISRIHLHAVYQSKGVPPEFNVDRGIPKFLKIEGACQPDFSDSVILLEKEFYDIGQIGPIMMWNVPETTSRYIRISGKPYLEGYSGYLGSDHIGFAEIELYAGGRNVALGKFPIRVGVDLPRNSRVSRLTDGQNFYGLILPMRTWMNQLARRHDLETELGTVAAQLKIRYDRREVTVKLLGWLTAVLAALVGLTILVGISLRKRNAAGIKERFTADLHDHLGASLHAIGILGSYTKGILDSPEKLSSTLDEITLMTARAGESIRYVSEQQMSKELHENLSTDLRRTAGRMIANLEYSFTIEGEEFLQNLKPRSRSDFFLFFKESLININRHANATEVDIRIVADPQDIHLSIRDNGRGILATQNTAIPPSLARRARLLGAKVGFETPENGGSCISLKLKTRRWFSLRPFQVQR